MKTLVNAIDYACRLREGPGNKNISLGSVLKLLLVSHIAVVFAALLVVAVAKSHGIIWQLSRAADMTKSLGLRLSGSRLQGLQ